jgi:hypothetical protein
MRIILLIAVAASFLAGCSGQDPISDEAASKIAALSQDSHKHQEAFAGAIQELSTEKGCQVDYMTDAGGFWRSSLGDYYFIHCGTLYSEDNITTWYFNPKSNVLSRMSAAM